MLGKQRVDTEHEGPEGPWFHWLEFLDKHDTTHQSNTTQILDQRP